MSNDEVSHRSRRVLIGSVLALVFDVLWTIIVALFATPCAGWSSIGILEPTPECPVQATHIVSAVIGGTSCIAIYVAVAAGISCYLSGGTLMRRVFRGGLLVAAALIVVWLVLTIVLPRKAGSG
jgi:hypothetical protein